MNREEDSRFASKPVEPTDAELVGRALSGSSRAFATLVSRHQGLITGVARRFGTSGMEAADVVQDVFLHAYGVLRQLKNPERFAAWLYRLAVNRCMDVRRQDRSRQRALDGLMNEKQSPATAGSVLDALSRSETREIVRAAVEQLSDELREVVYLRYFNGLTYEHIADMLNVPFTTVDGRLRRAKAQLMRELSAGGGLSPDVNG